MLKSARNEEKDPEGRMPLADHLRELRNRLAKAMLAIVIVTVVAAFFYNDIINFLTDPILKSIGCKQSFAELATSSTPDEAAEKCARITINGLLAPFNLALQVSLMAGIVIASPIWLYQLWAFVAPGLHRHEKKYAYAFVFTGAPLFIGGGYFAYSVLPTTAKVLIEFTPSTSIDNQLPLDDLLQLVTRMVLVFGLSFELPLLLIFLNLTGMITGKRMLGWWRGMIMGITVFAAVATPSTDPLSMLALAGPIWVLYFGATLFSLVNDKRRRRRDAEGPADDEASDLDLTPEDIGEIETVSASRALPEQASAPERVNGYDDVT